MDNIYYVYEWFNVDTGEVFYVGKGKGSRYKNKTKRNQYFINYVNKYNCNVRKIKENLTEEEAFNFEIDTIAKYKKIGECKCNLSLGGEGSSLDKNTVEYMIRKLRVLHDLHDAMDDMENENDYSVENLKTKSFDELVDMYYEYLEFKDGVSTAKEFGLTKEFDAFELMMRDKEIYELTRLLIKKYSEKYNKYIKLLNYKNELDFMCSDLNYEPILKYLLSDKNYCVELFSIIIDNLYLLKMTYYNPFVDIAFKIKNYVLNDNYILIKIRTKEEWKPKTVKVDIYDLIFGVIIYGKTKPLFQIIYEEILSAPIIN